MYFSVCSFSPASGVRVKLPNGVMYDADVMETPVSHALGMQFRPPLPGNRVMLFVYDKPAPRAYHMRNVRMPLEIITIDDSQRVSEFRWMEPDSGPFRFRAHLFAIEAPRGWIRLNHLKLGDRIDLG